MRHSAIIAITLFVVFLLGFRPLTNPVYITGHLKRNPKDTTAYVEGILVIVKGDSKILAKTFTDNKGNFELTFTPNNEKSFDFYCHGVAVDTLLIASVTKFESDTPDITFYIPAQIKKNAFGQPLCPKCKRADMVHKIAYGDGLPIRMEVSEAGDTTYSSIVNGRFNAGTCLVGVAKYFCDRDKVKF
jgi:hypothetical protein